MITEELCTQDSSLWRLQRPKTVIQKLSSLPFLLFRLTWYFRHNRGWRRCWCYCPQTHDIRNIRCHRLGNDYLYVGHPVPILLADNVNLLIKYLCFMATWSWVPPEYPLTGSYNGLTKVSHFRRGWDLSAFSDFIASCSAPAIKQE